jgi:hypothetical protein
MGPERKDQELLEELALGIQQLQIHPIQVPYVSEAMLGYINFMSSMFY